MERRDRYEGIIVSDPAVMLGKPVIAGTRITVELILEMLSAGATVDDVLHEYPHLTRESIGAALAFAADAVQVDRAHTLAAGR